MSRNDPIREAPFERSLPNSSEAERAILGAVILDQGLIAQAVELLKSEDFYIPSHRRIFVAMLAIFERGGEINPIIIAEELKKENALESVGGISFVTNLTYGLPHSTNIAHYAKVVSGKAYLRRLIKTASKITNEALEEEDEPEVIGTNAESMIFGLRDQNLKGGRLEVLSPIAQEILETLQEQEGRARALIGVTSGFADIDEKTSGWQEQDLILIAGRPSMGKTAFALMLAQNAVIEAPESVVAIFSMEMSKKSLVSRMLCSQANVDAQRFRNGFLSRAEWSVLATALGALADKKIFIDDSAGLQILEMRAKLMRLVSEQKRIDEVIVDYIQLAKGSKKRYDSDHAMLTEISHDLKGLAKEFNVPVIALSQLSRAPEKRSDPRPQLSDLRGSGTLEEDADVVAFIHREEYFKNHEQRMSMPEDKKNVAEIILAKNRNGPTGTAELRWIPSSMRFDNLYHDHQQGLPARDYHNQ